MEQLLCHLEFFGRGEGVDKPYTDGVEQPHSDQIRDRAADKRADACSNNNRHGAPLVRDDGGGHKDFGRDEQENAFEYGQNAYHPDDKRMAGFFQKIVLKFHGPQYIMNQRESKAQKGCTMSIKLYISNKIESLSHHVNKKFESLPALDTVVLTPGKGTIKPEIVRDELPRVFCADFSFVKLSEITAKNIIIENVHKLSSDDIDQIFLLNQQNCYNIFLFSKELSDNGVKYEPVEHLTRNGVKPTRLSDVPVEKNLVEKIQFGDQMNHFAADLKVFISDNTVTRKYHADQRYYADIDNLLGCPKSIVTLGSYKTYYKEDDPSVVYATNVPRKYLRPNRDLLYGNLDERTSFIIEDFHKLSEREINSLVNIWAGYTFYLYGKMTDENGNRYPIIGYLESKGVKPELLKDPTKKELKAAVPDKRATKADIDDVVNFYEATIAHSSKSIVSLEAEIQLLKYKIARDETFLGIFEHLQETKRKKK